MNPCIPHRSSELTGLTLLKFPVLSILSPSIYLAHYGSGGGLWRSTRLAAARCPIRFPTCCPLNGYFSAASRPLTCRVCACKCQGGHAYNRLERTPAAHRQALVWNQNHDAGNGAGLGVRRWISTWPKLLPTLTVHLDWEFNRVESDTLPLVVTSSSSGGASWFTVAQCQ